WQRLCMSARGDQPSRAAAPGQDGGAGRTRPPLLVFVLAEELEVGAVHGSGAVVEDDLELAAGAGPGGIGLPAVAVVARCDAVLQPGLCARARRRHRMRRPGRAG